MAATFVLRILPFGREPSVDAAARLFAAAGEYARALDAVAGAILPDEVFLHLFAYEIAERARERAVGVAANEEVRMIVPLWPEALFRAAGIRAHGAYELEWLMPPIARVELATASEEECARAMIAWLGAVRAAPARYIATLAEIATERGWAR